MDSETRGVDELFGPPEFDDLGLGEGVLPDFEAELFWEHWEVRKGHFEDVWGGVGRWGGRMEMFGDVGGCSAEVGFEDMAFSFCVLIGWIHSSGNTTT